METTWRTSPMFCHHRAHDAVSLRFFSVFFFFSSNNENFTNNEISHAASPKGTRAADGKLSFSFPWPEADSLNSFKNYIDNYFKDFIYAIDFLSYLSYCKAL